MQSHYYYLQRMGIVTLLGLAAMATPAIEPDHHHEPVNVSQLYLKNGQNWPTDASLRQGMTHIREILTPSLPAVQEDKLAAGDYEQLATRIDSEIAFIVQNCHLEKEADAMLHVVLAKLMAGTNAMADKDKPLGRQEGARQVAQALKDYGDYFAHPGW